MCGGGGGEMETEREMEEERGGRGGQDHMAGNTI